MRVDSQKFCSPSLGSVVGQHLYLQILKTVEGESGIIHKLMEGMGLM